MKIRIPVAVICVSTLACVSGCASIYTRSRPLPQLEDHGCMPRYIYPGTEISAHMAGSLFTRLDRPAECDGYEYVLGPIGLIDLPFSFVLDTIAFPYDFYRVTLGDRTRTGHPEQQKVANH